VTDVGLSAPAPPVDRGRVDLGRRPPPGIDVIEALTKSLGGMAALGFESLVSLFTKRPVWFREFLIQCVFVTRVVLSPVMGVNAVFGFTIIGLALGTALEQLGAIDRSAGFLGPGLIREFGVFMTGAVLAGVVGTTYTAEFGARKIREELDALRVLGVDPVASMVVPRIVALTVMAVVIFVMGFIAGAIGTYLAVTVYYHRPGGLFLPQLLANVSYVDLWAGVLKSALFGFLIAVISSFKGLTAEGGAEGVGRAVNESVVACFVAVFFVNIVYTQFLLALYPDVANFR
jgi:phospholipid/cholesterol/gamma-HCH transport system permease protein